MEFQKIVKKMKKLDVEHYLGIYKIRKYMHEKGTTNPSVEIKKFINEFVEKLQNMPLEEEIILKDRCFFDSSGNIIIKLPDLAR